MSRVSPKNIDIDHSRGRAFVNEGVVYYSPNSTHQVTVPQRHITSYRFYKRDADLHRFQVPEWWTTPYGYLSCIPLLPSFNGTVFSCLRDILSSIEERQYPSHSEYAMEARKLDEWVNLETALIQMASLLRKKFIVGATLDPIPPSLLGIQRVFTTRRSAISRFTTIRDWFVVWMGLLSYIIAQIEYLKLNNDIPDWFTHLVNAEFSQTWLSGFQQSGVCNFSRNSLQVGIFIDWLEIDKSTAPPPHLAFFYIYNIPVWYPWTVELGEAIAKNPALSNLQPPPEHLQSAATFINKQPSMFAQFVGISEFPTPNFSPLAAHMPSSQPSTWSPVQSPAQSAVPPSPVHVKEAMSHRALLDARLAHAKTKPWLTFFQAREARNLEKEATETLEARQTRLNRERKPPQKKVEVYIWDWSDEDPLQLVRTRVMTNRERQDALETFSSSQSIYDSWSNAWDLCDYFGQPDEDVDAEDDDEGDNDLGDNEVASNEAGDNEAAHAAYIADRINHPVAFLSYKPLETADVVDISDVADTGIPFDILDYLSTHYGFVCPLSFQKHQPVPREAWDSCMKALGRYAGATNPPLSDFDQSIIGFVNALQTPVGPTCDEFDNFPANRVTIKTAKLFSDIIIVDGFFVVQPHAFQAQHSFPWTIAVYDVPRALFVFRLLLKCSHTPATLAHILLDEGVAFRTVQPLRDVLLKSSLRDHVTIVPIRLSNYVFKASDYEVYVHQRASILSSPRGRAALLRGGLVSRLAREHLAIGSACLGPSSSVVVHRVGFSITDKEGRTYWDDQLTDDEIDVICGLHRCFTGNGAQQALVSWWPLPVQWDNVKANGFNWGYWTEWDELWYRERLSSIHHGGATPLSASGWRSKLRGLSTARSLTAGILKHSKNHILDN